MVVEEKEFSYLLGLFLKMLPEYFATAPRTLVNLKEKHRTFTTFVKLNGIEYITLVLGCISSNVNAQRICLSLLLRIIAQISDCLSLHQSSALYELGQEAISQLLQSHKCIVCILIYVLIRHNDESSFHQVSSCLHMLVQLSPSVIELIFCDPKINHNHMQCSCTKACSSAFKQNQTDNVMKFSMNNSHLSYLLSIFYTRPSHTSSTMNFVNMINILNEYNDFAKLLCQTPMASLDEINEDININNRSSIADNDGIFSLTTFHNYILDRRSGRINSPTSRLTSQQKLTAKTKYFFNPRRKPFSRNSNTLNSSASSIHTRLFDSCSSNSTTQIHESFIAPKLGGLKYLFHILSCCLNESIAHQTNTATQSPNSISRRSQLDSNSNTRSLLHSILITLCSLIKHSRDTAETIATISPPMKSHNATPLLLLENSLTQSSQMNPSSDICTLLQEAILSVKSHLKTPICAKSKHFGISSRVGVGKRLIANCNLPPYSKQAASTENGEKLCQSKPIQRPSSLSHSSTSRTSPNLSRVELKESLSVDPGFPYIRHPDVRASKTTNSPNLSKSSEVTKYLHSPQDFWKHQIIDYVNDTNNNGLGPKLPNISTHDYLKCEKYLSPNLRKRLYKADSDGNIVRVIPNDIERKLIIIEHARKVFEHVPAYMCRGTKH